MPRTTRWLLALLVIALVGVLSAPVAAHAYLDETDPGNGQQVEELPDEVTLSFTGDGIQIAEVEIIDSDGNDVSGDAEIDPDDTRIVTVPVEDTGEGIYTVQWEVLADDGHTTSGSFFFAVGEEEPDREQLIDLHTEGGDDELAVGEILPKGGLLLALLALVGAPITLLAAVYPVAGRFGIGTNKLDRRANTALLGATGLLVLSALALGLVQAAGATGLSVSGLAAFVGLDLGRAWLAQLALGAVLLGVLWVGRRGRLAPKTWLIAAVVVGLAVQATISATSHSASFEGIPGIGIHMGHLVGGALWVGGLVVLAAFVPRMLRGHAEARTAAAAIVRRFSVLAVAGVALAVASGLVLTAWHVPDLAALGETIYGQALSIKIALVVGALGLGGLNRFVLHRRLRGEPGRLRPVLPDGGERFEESRSSSDHRSDGGNPLRNFTRSVRLEVGLVVCVILVSGIVTAAPTATMAADGEGAEWVTMTEGEEPEVELAVLPGEEGPNVIDAMITDDGEPVSPDDEVTLLVREEDGSALPQVELEPEADGTYSTVSSFASDGVRELRVDFWYDEEYVTETFTVEIDGADEDHAEHDHDDHAEHDDDDEPNLFGNALVIGALWVGLIGVMAMSYETRRVRKES